jgi:hypothetical protein
VGGGGEKKWVRKKQKRGLKHQNFEKGVEKKKTCGVWTEIPRFA